MCIRDSTYLTPDGDRYYKDDSWNGGVFSSFALSASDRELLHSSDMVHTTFSGPNFNDVIAVSYTHLAPEKRGHQRYSVFIGYPEHTVIPELLTEHSFHKPACEVFKRRAGNKSHKENLKSVISERMTDKQQEQSADTVYRNIWASEEASVYRPSVIDVYKRQLQRHTR